MVWHSGRWFWLVTGMLVLALLYLLAPILTPFLVAAFLAYLGDPLVDRLERLKLTRTLAVTVVFVVICLVLLGFFLLVVPVLETQVKQLLAKMPGYLEWTMNVLAPYLSERFGVDPSVLEVERLKSVVASHWKETGGIIRNTIQAISHSGVVVLGWVANLALVPIITFYLLRDWDRLVAYINDLLPRAVEPLLVQLARESDDVLGAFLRGQLLVMLALAMIYSIGLSLVGLEFALLIGLIAGLVSFVPYLGLIVGVGIAALAVLFQTPHELFNLVWVFAVFVIAQVIEGTILTPLLVGEKIGLHPVAVIFSVLAGGQLFGFFGVLLALPLAAVLAVILRHIHDTYKASQIYGLGETAVAAVQQENTSP